MTEESVNNNDNSNSVDIPEILKNFVNKAIDIAQSPKTEMEKIASEEYTAKSLVINFLLPALVLSQLASFIGMQVFGISFFGTTYRPDFFPALVSMILQVVLGVLVFFCNSFVLSKISAYFSGTDKLESAQKALVFSMLPALLFSVINLVPVLGVLMILAFLYSTYIFYIALDKVLSVQQRVVALIASIVAFVVVGLILGLIFTVVTPNTYPTIDAEKQAVESLESLQKLAEKYGANQ